MKKIFIILLIILIGTVLYFSAYKKSENITMQNNTKPELILDVRNLDEWNAGHGKNSKLIPLSELESRLGEIGEYKNNEVVVVCRSGNRAASAILILEKAGFTNLKNGGTWENFKE